MSRRIDKDIFWVVLIAAVFWTGVWQHEWVVRSLHRLGLALSSYGLW